MEAKYYAYVIDISKFIRVLLITGIRTVIIAIIVKLVYFGFLNTHNQE